ncbi:sterol 24-c-methyltransferase-like protein [Phyllosticta citrichinensis]|uniref:Sterol 24-C-methyltransferase n=1 Tax=Phyllosticta citrichinensis TaxID=1130410 RepID=A0ABR1XMM2_9PEZI
MSSSTPQQLEMEDKERDRAFKEALHGKSGQVRGGTWAMLNKKNNAANSAALDEYFKHWDERKGEDETEEVREQRRKEYATLTRHYYNLATDLYEQGWAQSFHFCRFAKNEPFKQALARHEHYLAHVMGLRDGMKVLDVGCGVGGPAREICKFSGANIVGLNNNDYQIDRATYYAEKEGLSDKISYVKGDFMQMSFEDNSFDAVYAIEATVHAPTLEGIYGEIFRVLKPGGVFGVYEWLMTDKYDDSDAHHRDLRLGIEQGDGISNMCTVSVALEAMKKVGFELEVNEDLADRPDPRPWYWPLAGNYTHMDSVWEFLHIFRMTKVGRSLAHKFCGALEYVGLAPKGTQKTADSLAYAADSLVAAGEEKLFTPMYLMVGRKPSA